MVVTAGLALLASTNRRTAPRTSTAGKRSSEQPRTSESHSHEDDLMKRAAMIDNPVLEWSPSRVSTWLKEECDDELAQAALDASLDGTTLAHLDADAWAELGVRSRVEQARVLGKVKAVFVSAMRSRLKATGDDSNGGDGGGNDGVFRSRSHNPTKWDSSTGRGGDVGNDGDEQRVPSVVMREGPTLSSRFGYLAWVAMFVPWLMTRKNWIGGAEHRSYWHQAVTAANVTNGSALKDHYLRFLGMYNVIDLLSLSISVDAVFSTAQPVSVVGRWCKSNSAQLTHGVERRLVSTLLKCRIEK